jgi:hypothetical protein
LSRPKGIARQTPFDGIKNLAKKGARDFAEKPYDDGASIYFIRSTAFLKYLHSFS